MTAHLSLEGKLLIAMPGIGDPRFERSVIFMCAHTAAGSMGIVINKEIPGISFSELLTQLEIETKTRLTGADDVPVQFGGPVEVGRGFVLHTADYHAEGNTQPVGGSIAMTATIDVLRAIAEGEGPRSALLALGYAGWSPGQLESEIKLNGWLHCDADEALLFESSLDKRYPQALNKIGIDPSMLSAQAGHA